MSFRGNVSRLWVKLTGEPSAFPLESRIFHSVSVMTAVVLAYNVPFNFIIKLPVVAIIDFAIFLVSIYLYYISRFKGRTNISTVAYGIFGNLLLISNYFLNSGISGPTNLITSLLVVLIIAISPKKQYKAWLALNIIIALFLSAIEYFYPQLVPNTYIDRESRFIDITSAYMVGIFLSYYIVTHLKGSYEKEKQQAEEKTRAVEQQTELILVQNQQLEYINSEKNKLLSIIAHDLRGPLSNIQSYLELVNEFGLDLEERQIVESDLLKVTQNTLNMLSKLLIWSKSQMEGVVVKLSDVNLLASLKSTLEMERVLALKKEIVLTYTIDPLITVVADNDMLQLVVRNLVSNAIKFTPSGGIVDIHTEMVLNDCKLTVKDNGNGIAWEQQPEIFSLKAKSTFGTGNEKGVGLGLLLCKEFTESQGGRIGFESAPGLGSEFFIYLPVG